jgi:hypothetical protein
LTFNGGDVSGGQVTITGVPLVGGTFDFAVQVTLSDGVTLTKSYEIAVAFNTSPIFLPDASVGTPYSQQLTIGPLHDATTEKWTVSSGALPAGVTLSPAGLLSGTPTGPDGTLATFSVQVAALFPGNPLPCNCTFGPLTVQIGGCGQTGAAIPTDFTQTPPGSIGTFTVLPNGTIIPVTANGGIGTYQAIYRGGTIKGTATAPTCFNLFTFPHGFVANYGGGSISISDTTAHMPGQDCGVNQAVIENLVPIGKVYSFTPSVPGAINLQWSLDGTQYVCGDTCPSWEIISPRVLIVQPVNLRIHNYLVPNMNGDDFNDLIANGNCPSATVHPLFATSTKWNGSFGGTVPPNSVGSHGDSYSAATFIDQTSYVVADKIIIGDGFFLDLVIVQGPVLGSFINGEMFNFGFGFGTLPANQNFWYFKITSNSQPGVKPGTPTLIWAGVKSYGQTSLGHYLTIANCNPNAPQCLTIEEAI